MFGEKSNYKNFCQTFWSGSFELLRAHAGQLQTTARTGQLPRVPNS
jgi:hypothetical protein